MPAKAPQYMDTMKVVWEHTHAEWRKVGAQIAGRNGFRAVHAYSTKLAHPPLPVFMYLLHGTLVS